VSEADARLPQTGPDYGKSTAATASGLHYKSDPTDDVERFKRFFNKFLEHQLNFLLVNCSHIKQKPILTFLLLWLR